MSSEAASLADPSPHSVPTWDDAPCGLLDLDETGLVIHVNARLLRRTGYTKAEVLGRAWVELLSAGSRLFYETQLVPVLLLDGALQEVMVDLVARDGRRVPALINVEVIAAAADAPARTRLAVMSVPDRRVFEEELLKARRQAESANDRSDRARRRLELQSRASAALTSTTDLDDALARLARVLVPGAADWCVLYTIDPAQPEEPMGWSAHHTAPGRQKILNRLAELTPVHATPTSHLRRILAGRPTVLMPIITDEHLQNATDSDEVRDLYSRLGVGSMIVAPCYAHDTRVAALLIGRGTTRAPFTDEDRSDLSELAARAGVVIDNLRRYSQEHANSVTLQNALLTAPPSNADLDIVVRYLPAQDRNQVGGDWYDAYQQPDGATVVSIGDVVGHDISAAAAMGQLRGVIRTIGHTIAGTPADTLHRADLAIGGLQIRVLASAILARIEPTPDRTRPRTLHWTNAGHPPPVIVCGTGQVVILERPPDILLGVSPERPRHDHVTALNPGDTLFLYTDGLIERPTEDIDTGLARLAAALNGAQHRTLDEVCDTVLPAMLLSQRDDIALIAVRVPHP